MELKRKTYVVSYDIHDNEEEKVRGAFRKKLEESFSAEQLCESTYAFSKSDSVGRIKADILSAYEKARENSGEGINGDDKIWLICSDKKANMNDKNFYEMCCYELIGE